VAPAQGVELGTQRRGLWNGHVGCVEQALSRGTTARIGIGQAAVDGLAHDRRDGYPSLSCGSRDSSMAIVVNQKLEPMI